MDDDVTPRSVPQGMSRLKELLFDGDADTLSGINRRLAELESLGNTHSKQQLEALQQLENVSERSGSDERFRKSVAKVLDKALEDAEVNNHAEMSRAIAPLVVNTIKTELKNNQDELVDLMFPITGRMVRSYVSSEMKRLSQSVNRRIDANPMMLRVRSLASGRPVSDLAIADSQRLAVDEVYLIRRDSGELIAHWPPSTSSLSNSDMHMSGVLAAINDFASSAFSGDGGHFESFRYEDFQVFMRASSVYLLAAKCSGVAPSGIEQIFDDAFIETIERINALEQAAAKGSNVTTNTRSLELHPLTETVESQTADIYDEIARSSVGGAVIKAALFLITVPLLTWFFWGLYTNAEEAIVHRSAQHAINSTDGIAGYQTNVEVGYRGKSLTVTGLLPDAEAKSALTAALTRELPGTDIKAQIAVIPAKVEVIKEVSNTPAIDPEALERRLYGRLASLENQWVSRNARRAVERARAHLAQTKSVLDQLERTQSRDGVKADLSELNAALAKTLGTVEMLAGRIQQPNTSLTEMSQLLEPANNVTKEIASLLRALAITHGAKPPAENVVEPALTFLAATENADVEAERLANLALSVNQTAAMIPKPVPVSEKTPQEHLRKFAAENALFFSSGTSFVSDEQAKLLLDEAARRMNAADNLVRVVGYTDERGSNDQNSTLAQNRAARVIAELVRRGVPRNRLVGLGRLDSISLSPKTGAASPNRRVEFEVGFRGEKRNTP